MPQPQASHTVILLLTNSNQSQAPPGGGELFGSGNPLLRKAMEERSYAAPVRHTFVVARTDGGQSLNVDVTALFPAQIKGLPDAPKTARVAFPVDSWQPPGDRPGLPRRAGKPWIYVLSVVIIGGAGLGLIGLRQRTRSQGQVETQKLVSVASDEPSWDHEALRVLDERLAMLEAMPKEAERLRTSVESMLQKMAGQAASSERCSLDVLARLEDQQQLNGQLMQERQEAGNARRRVGEWQDLAVEYLSLLERAIVDEGLDPTMRQGMEVSLRQFERLARRQGVTTIAPHPGEPFDEVMHRYVGEEKSAQAPPGTVLHCKSWGYQLGERVARQADVVLVAAEVRS